MGEVTLLLEKLASKLGTTAEYLWAVLVRQAPINSVINIIEWGIMGLLTWLIWKGFKRAYKKADDESWDEVWLIFPIVIGVTLLIVWIAVICTVSSTITGFVNPEYWALKEVLDTIRKK